MAHRRQEAALGVVSPLHLLVHQQQLAVEFGEFVGTLGHPRLQVLVRFAQHPLRRPEGGDVGEGHHEAPRRHGVALHLDHPPIRPLPRRDMGAAPLHEGNPARHLGLDIARSAEPLLGVVADDLLDGAPHLDEPVRIVEQLYVAPVPGHQLEFPVHHRDPLPHVLYGPLQQAAVEAEHVRGLVHYGGYLLELHVAPLQGGGQHQPGGRGAKHPGQQPLGVGNQIGRRLHLGRKGAAVLAGEATEGALDPARADEAGRQHLQLLDRDPRLVERRGVPARLADEVGGLQPLAHRRP